MAKPPVRMPVWLRPEPGVRKVRFTRERIAAAALALADREGFEAVSMRRVAAALGAGTMSLYHYVRTKDELVELMDDALMAEVLVPEKELPADWRGALTAIAQRTRAVFVRHPWALVSLQGTLPGPNGARHFEQCLAALAGTQLGRADKLELLAHVDDFVFGHVLRSSEAHARRDLPAEAVQALAEFGKAQLASGAFPHTAKLLEGLSPQAASAEVSGVATEQARFERGLAALLDGAALRLKLR